MNRLEKLREYIDGVLRENSDIHEGRNGMVHLYGVSLICVALAKKRGLDEELAAMAGMLHDIYTYRHQYCPDHGEKGAVLARKILTELELTNSDETDILCDAILHHSHKKQMDGPYAELLKDADVWHHITYNPAFPISGRERERYGKLLAEFGMQ